MVDPLIPNVHNYILNEPKIIRNEEYHGISIQFF